MRSFFSGRFSKKCVLLFGIFALLLLPASASAAVDLSMASWNSSSSARGYNSTIRITYQIKNSGTTAAGSFEVSFYYKDHSGTSTSSQALLGKVKISSLGAAKTTASAVVSYRLPKSVLFGTRYLHYVIDSGKTITESNEKNNWGRRSLLITGQPNLRVIFLSRTPDTQVRNGYVTLNYRMYNYGYSRAAGVYSGFYFSTDSSISTTDTYLGRVYTSSIPAQSYSPLTTSGSYRVRIPSNAATGNRYIGIFADYLKRIRESSETDNTRATPIKIVSALPNLYLASISAPSSAVGYRSKITLRIRTRNIGTADAAAHYVYFYYGSSSARTNLRYIGNFLLPSAKKGSYSVYQTKVMYLPNSVVKGKRYLHWYVDAPRRIKEIDENNNRGARAINITGSPDLQVSALSVSPSTQVKGGQLAVIYRLYNAGTTAATAFKSRFYYSTDSGITTGDAYLNVEVARTNLYAKATYSGTTTVILPSNATAGTRYIGAITDYDKKVAESSENNNTRAAAFKVGTSISDLSMATWKSTASAKGYSSKVVVTMTIRNSGSSNAAAFMVTVYYGDSKSTSGLTTLGTHSFATGLKANTTATAVVKTFTLPKNVLYGSRYIHYFIDSGKKVNESSETNNWGNKALSITGKPDFRVIYVRTSPTSQVKGGYLTVNYRIYNYGYSRASRSFYTSVYYSVDSTITTRDSYVGRVYTRSLNARSSDPASGYGKIVVRVPTGATNGRRYIGMITDIYRYISEESETNNTSARAFTVTSAKPELRMLSFTAPSSAIGYRSKVTTTMTIRNDGGANAGAFYVYVYYNESTSSSGLTYLNRYRFSSLKAKSNSAATKLVVTLPNRSLAGKRYLHYYVDATNSVGEINDLNNRGYRSINITGKPNLIVSYLRSTPTSQLRNGQVAVRYRVTNVGTTRTHRSFYTAVYFSKDATITTRDSYLGRYLLTPTINAGSSDSYRTINVRIPRNATIGRGYIGIIADYARYIPETKETDNTRSGVFTVVTSQEELNMLSFSGTKSARGSGSKITVQFKVRNTGSANARSFYTYFYYGNSTATSPLTYLGRYFHSKGLAKGTSDTARTAVFTLPTTVVYGARRIHYYVDAPNYVGEITETNNRGSIPISITGKPDIQLSVYTISPSSQVRGGQIVIAYKIYNAGYSRANTYFDTRFYYSTDGTIKTSDTYLGRTARLGSLNARTYWPSSSNATTTVVVPRNAAAGTRYIGAIADYSGRIAESVETNNIKSASFTIGSTQADLYMSTWSVPKSARGSGSKVTIQFKVGNSGTADAGSFDVGFYYGNSASRSGLAFLGKWSSAGIKKATTDSTRTLVVTLPNTVYYGRRAIHYTIDYTAKVAEIRETNNQSYRYFNITGKPDLQVLSVTLSPTTQIRRGQVRITYEIRNAGYSVASGIYTGFYYSIDSTITKGDKYLQRAYVRTLNAQSNTTKASVLVYVPSTASLNSTRYMGVFADYLSRISETSESNNTKAVPFKVTGSIADLYVASMSTTSTAVGNGSSVSALFRIRNNGTADAGAFDVSFYYGDSPRSTNLTYLGKKAVSSLKKKVTTGNLAVVLKLGANTLSGARYIHAFVDSANKIVESYETNNRRYSSIKITGKPNLQVSMLTVSPSSQYAGGNISTSYRIVNKGQTRADNSYLRLYYSANSTITTSDVNLRELFVKSVNAGASWPATTNGKGLLKIPTNAAIGTRYIGAIADYSNRVTESSETDNTKAARITVTGRKADLMVSSLKVTPIKQQTGKTVKIDYVISNAGAANAGAFVIGIFHSTNSLISTADTLLASINATGLNIGKTISGSKTVTLPKSLAAGNAFIGVYVDRTRKVSETNENNNGRGTAVTILVDKDGDGYANDVDCNDSDKTVHPKAKELCDGKDNNCDKKIDEGCKCIKNTKRACYSGATGCKKSGSTYTCTAPCKAGTQTCTGTNWGACTGEVAATKEICDGKDNDCDGKVDNIAGKSDPLAKSCYGGPTGTQGKGICKAGTQTCTNGKYSACKGEVKPGKEVCDGKDNDCDGKTDNDPNGSGTLTQACSSACGKGKESCNSGKWENCSAPKTCNEVPQNDGGGTDGPIADAGTTDKGTDGGILPEGGGDKTQPETPADSDCYTSGCSAGQICKESKCVNDPCNGISCKSGEFCREGKCLTACGCKACASGEKCIDGSCSTDSCASVSCSNGEICDPSNGQCITDPCASVTCGSKRVCQAGKCVDDACSYISCPSSMSCKAGQCVGNSCQNENTGEGEITGDGGTTDGGAGDQGLTDQGAGDQGTTDQGVGDQGTTDQGAGDQGAGDKGNDPDKGSNPDKGTVITDKGPDGTTVDKGTGNEADPDGGTTTDGGGDTGCGCTTSSSKRGSFYFLFAMMFFLLPFFRRRR